MEPSRSMGLRGAKVSTPTGFIHTWVLLREQDTPTPRIETALRHRPSPHSLFAASTAPPSFSLLEGGPQQRRGRAQLHKVQTRNWGMESCKKESQVQDG